jgi:hypothetical protein
VEVDRPELFKKLPEIDLTGKLSFELMADATGETGAQVYAQDNGGTELGGNDTSEPMTFQFIIDDSVDPNDQVLDNETSGDEQSAPPLLLWQNTLMREDVNGDGLVTPFDALLIINQLNKITSQPSTTRLPTRNENSGTPFYFYDVSGNDDIEPFDLLLVINFLNRASSTLSTL